MLLIRAESRDSLREAVLLCMMPFWADLMISGWAAFRASAATDLSPERMASSTFLIKVLIRERRSVFFIVRRAIFLTAFLAELVLAIPDFTLFNNDDRMLLLPSY